MFVMQYSTPAEVSRHSSPFVAEEGNLRPGLMREFRRAYPLKVSQVIEKLSMMLVKSRRQRFLSSVLATRLAEYGLQ